MRRLFLIVCCGLLVLGGGAALYLNMLSGLIAGDDGLAPLDTPRRQVFAVIANDLSNLSVAGLPALPLNAPQPSDNTAVHRFFGRIAPKAGNACLISMAHARGGSIGALRSNSGQTLPLPDAFVGCDGFARVSPPAVPAALSALGPLKRSVSHFCAPNLTAGAYRMWQSDLPSAQLSIATLAEGQTADDLVAALATELPGDQILRIGKPDPVRLTREHLLAQTRLRAVATLRCTGFTVAHIEASVIRWPLHTTP